MNNRSEPAALPTTDSQPDTVGTQAPQPDRSPERSALSVLISLPSVVAECLVVVFAVVIVVGRNYPPDARLFPTVVASLGLLLCAIFLGASTLSPAYARRAADDREESAGDLRAFWVACITPPIYCLGIYLVGFHASTLIAMLVMPRLLGYRGWTRLIAIAVGTVVVLHLVFVVAVEVELPNGLLGEYILKTFIHDD
jgi:putative tricarboxylic transport membrane protein